MGKQFIVFLTVLFMATRAVSAAPYPADLGERTSILVLPFESKGSGIDHGTMADDYLMEAFTSLNRFTIVEREKLDRVLLEQKLTRKKLTAPEHSIALGRLLSADQMLSGRIEEIRGETIVTIRLVATATSATRNYSAAVAAPGMREFRRLITDIAAKVANDFPLFEGKVIRTTENSFTADFVGQGLRVGLEAIIFRWGDAVLHPTTGRALGRKAIRVASATISAVTGKTCSLTLSKIEKGRIVKEGDLVITR